MQSSEWQVMDRPVFAVGYRLFPEDGETFAEIVGDFREHIGEVYFAWPEEASGRSPLAAAAAERMRAELAQIRQWGIRLNLLFNAACYGVRAVSRELADHIVRLTGKLRDDFGITAVTTMSPVIAGAVRREFPDMDVRASVNMRLGTVQGMEYVADLFSSYNVQREYNRDPERLQELQEWAWRNGKRLHALVNSGCMNFCSFQTFHDNVVAHEADGAPGRDAVQIPTLCRHYYADRAHWVNFLRGSWIRPEDIVRHMQFFHGEYKLATRAHDNPRQVIGAYSRGKFFGNLPDLMEPGFAPAFYPFYFDNQRMPADWFDRTFHCNKRCADCGYCREVLDAIATPIPADA